MADKIEERLKKLEEQLKNEFSIMDRRLVSVESKAREKPVAAPAAKASAPPKAAEGGEPVVVEGKDRLETLEDMRERLQELEDLLLLIELENTKLRESIAAGGGAGTEIAPAVAPNVVERLNRVEEQLSLRTEAVAAPPEIDEKLAALEAKMQKLADLEERLEEIVEKKVGKHAKILHDKIDKVHEKMEKAPKVVTRVERTVKRPGRDEEDSSILEEVQMILKNKD